MKAILIALCLLALPLHHAHAQFDQQHEAWDKLARKYVVLIDGGRASQVRYAALAQDRNAFGSYLASLSGVSEGEFNSWSKAQRMAFLINAYNAFTIEKILTRYPDLKSIRDFGIVFGNPWKEKFFKLLGQPCSLDQIEHEMLRARGAYEEARVHYALNCAAVGCPMLRAEAYVADRLDAQLEDQARRFLSDRTRNRYNERKNSLEVSKIFDWYKEDWMRGYSGIDTNRSPIDSREQYFARYTRLLADSPQGQKLIAEQAVRIDYLDYDWSLNDAKP